MLKKLINRIREGLKPVSKKVKAVISAMALLAILLPSTVNVEGTKAVSGTPTPRFNYMQGDVEMLRAAKPGDNYADPISAQNGDKVIFLVYFHNGVEGSVAHNTKIRVDLPAGETNKVVATSYLWSDETPVINDTIVNGQIVGQTGQTINLTSKAKIRYVPGSTRMFVNGDQNGKAIPDGINTTNGINIGNINGCWQYSGYLTFQTEIFGNTQVTLDKAVSHLGSSTWYEQITATPGETVAYRIAVRNDGELTAASILIKDRLATYTSYVNGSTYLYNKSTGATTGQKMSDTLTTTGISLTNIAPGNDGVSYLVFKAKVSDSIPAGTYSLSNVGEVYIGTALQDRDEARIIVESTSTIHLNKTVYDSDTRSWEKIAQGEIGSIESFTVTVTNKGNVVAQNVVVKDILPMFALLYGDIKLDGVVLTATQKAAFLGSGLNIGSINCGASKSITFQVKVDGCPPLGETLITNTAYSSASGISEVTSSAQIRIQMNAPIVPIYMK